MCFDSGYGADVFDETLVRARKRYRCEECGGPIPPGVRYNRIGCLFEGEWSTMRVHWECRVLWGAVREDLCGGRGLIMIGALDEELSEYGAKRAQADDELGLEWDWEVPDEVARAMPYRRRFEAIRAHYVQLAEAA